MKVNDIVVLQNTSSESNKILELSKHLFEVIVNDKQNLWLESLDTGVMIIIAHEFVRLATLKERYLRDGNVVELEDGKKYYVNGYYLINIKEIGHYIRIKDFDDNMICKGNVYTFKVDKVYKLKENYMIEELIWERKPKIELTDDEKVILSNLDNEYKYINRRKGGNLLVTSEKGSVFGHAHFISIYNHLFKSITHESGVHEIKELLK